MYKVAFTIVTVLLLILANHPQAHAATPPNTSEPALHKTQGKLIQNPNKPERVLNTSAAHLSAASSAQPVEIYDVWFDMKDDTDGDGYYHRFDIMVDVDTVYSQQSIYVVGELDGQRLFQTEPYTLYGSSGSDTYRASVLLTDGYPTDQYALSLTVYDANNHHVLQRYDAGDQANLAELFLEDTSQESATQASLLMYLLEFELSEDRDGDGYFTDLLVRFDADAPGHTQWVYADINIVDHSGQWITLRTTPEFQLYDYDSQDQFSTRLQLNHDVYPDAYQIAIRLYDADHHNLLLTSTTPLSTPAHLESIDYDDTIYEEHTSVVIEEEYYYEEGSGGSMGWAFLCLMATLLWVRVLHKSNK